MPDLLKLAVVLALAFASTFVVMQWLDILPEEGVVAWLEGLRLIHPAWLILGVIGLLLLDLLVAVPTVTTILLAGWLLGPIVGGVSAAVGLLIMGSFGYMAGRYAGRPLLRRMYGQDQRLHEIEAAFARNDLLTLVVCQALPILPELSVVLAGVARMSLLRFAFGYALGSVPFAFIVAAAGAASQPDNLRPAILTAIAVTGTLLILWRLLLAQKQ